MPVPQAQQMVFRPDVIKKLTKQILETKTLIYVRVSKKSLLNIKVCLNSLKKKDVEIRPTSYNYYYCCLLECTYIGS